MLETGMKAPDFSLPNQDGETVNLSDFGGKKVVLYFYPKDDTPGCTTEACEFRDNSADFERIDAVVLGVSSDSVKSHSGFRDKYSLPFHLLADTEKQVHKAFGTWVEKKMYGRAYFGTQRATFVIDGEGIIRHVFPKVKPKGHSEEVKSVLALI
ncbi:MAG TPA: thioredoxin-dependent thiol peroxidase [Acidobacteriota bacterium]|nr:thioredoxin-dependent thiol peroxidase [Acidobacteriota bacterium]